MTNREIVGKIAKELRQEIEEKYDNPYEIRWRVKETEKCSLNCLNKIFMDLIACDLETICTEDQLMLSIDRYWYTMNAELLDLDFDSLTREQALDVIWYIINLTFRYVRRESKYYIKKSYYYRTKEVAGIADKISQYVTSLYTIMKTMKG